LARILLIDDNEDVRITMAALLESDGHEVVLARDGVDGIAAQRKSPARVVITDLLMPDKDGIETIRDLREEFSGVKIIAMSGAGSHVKRAASGLFAAKEAGADLVLQKPFAPGVLLKSIEDVLKSPGDG